MEALKNPDSQGRLESLEISGSTKQVNAHKGVIDTAAPFDSVKAAVNKFGGVIGWRARKVVGLEKDTDTQSEFEKVQEEIPKYKKQSEAAQIAKLQVLEELEITKKLIEELKDRLEKTETEVAQAKHNSDLSYFAKAKHEESIEELKSVREELESLSADYHRIITERDLGITSAQAALLAAKDAEKKVENLKEELKLLIDQKLAINDLKTKLETEPELAFHIQGENDNKKHTSICELASAKKEIQEVMASIKKTKDEVNYLREAASSLKTQLEQETKNISALKQREGITFTSVSSLEAEMRKMQSELELVLTKEREAREKMEQLPKLIEQATHDANQAKSIAYLACKELRNAREESDEAKASASAMEDKLLAAIKEIEAAKSYEALAVAAVKAISESKEFPIDNGVKLKLEEYYTLTKSAYNAEVLGNQKVINAAKKIEEAKNSELIELNKLEEVQKELEEKKEAVKAAEEMAEKANEGKLVAERELMDCDDEISHRRIASDVVASHYEKKKGDTKSPVKRVSSLSCPDFNDHTMTEVKPRRKKSFFPRIVMSLARKKAQSLK